MRLPHRIRSPNPIAVLVQFARLRAGHNSGNYVALGVALSVLAVHVSSHRDIDDPLAERDMLDFTSPGHRHSRGASADAANDQ
jgi:hypothetical protein